MFLQQLSTRKQKQTTIILMGVLWEYSSKIWLIVLKFFFISSLFLHLSSTLAPTSKLHEDVTGDKANSLPSSAQSWPRTHNELRPRARHLLIRQMWGAGGGRGRAVQEASYLSSRQSSPAALPSLRDAQLLETFLKFTLLISIFSLYCTDFHLVFW